MVRLVASPRASNPFTRLWFVSTYRKLPLTIAHVNDGAANAQMRTAGRAQQRVEGDVLLADEAAVGDGASGHELDHAGGGTGGRPGDRPPGATGDRPGQPLPHELPAEHLPAYPPLDARVEIDDVVVDRWLGIDEDLAGQLAPLPQHELVEEEAE